MTLTDVLETDSENRQRFCTPAGQLSTFLAHETNMADDTDANADLCVIAAAVAKKTT